LHSIAKGKRSASLRTRSPTNPTLKGFDVALGVNLPFLGLSNLAHIGLTGDSWGKQLFQRPTYSLAKGLSKQRKRLNRAAFANLMIQMIQRKNRDNRGSERCSRSGRRDYCWRGEAARMTK